MLLSLHHAERAIPSLAFFAWALSTILAPGPNMMYVATNGAERGPVAGALAAIAVVTGGVCYTITAAAGLTAVMAAHPLVLTAVRVAGIGYIVWLGVRLLVRVRDTQPAPIDHAPARAFRGGLFISLTNPQLAMFFVSFLPQFVVTGGATPVWLQMLRLGFTFNACSLMVMLSVAMIAGFSGQRAVGAVRFRQVTRAVAGVAFLVLAARSAARLLTH